MSVLPAKKNFTAWRGATWRKQLTVYQGADTDYDPRDLTGCEATMRIVDPTTKDELLAISTIALSPPAGSITLGDEDGTIDLVITDEVTADLEWDAGVYQLTLTAANGDVDAILYGQFSLRGL